MVHLSLVVDTLVIVVATVFIMVIALVLLLLIFSLIVTVADLRAVRSRALAAVGMDDGLCGRGTVFGVVDLPAQPIHAHALLRCHLVGAHLQRDRGVVQRLHSDLLIINVSSGAWSRHASLGQQYDVGRKTFRQDK